jgi:ASC-1-like (ASCH) protein
VTHYLKLVQPYFDLVHSGKKTFELRKNDRNFQVDDEVYLREYDPKSSTYSGKEVRATITFILENYPGIDDLFCIFSFKATHHIIKPPSQ